MNEEEKIYFRKCARVLEIIVKKNINTWRFKVDMDIDYKDYKYNSLVYHTFSIHNSNLLTEEEFDLVKEMIDYVLKAV